MTNQNEDIEKLKKLILETARDVAYLLDRCPDLNPGQMGGEVQHPTATERATELRTTLHDTRQYFGLNPDPDSGETL
jgi:hypothetical protein